MDSTVALTPAQRQDTEQNADKQQHSIAKTCPYGSPWRWFDKYLNPFARCVGSTCSCSDNQTVTADGKVRVDNLIVVRRNPVGIIFFQFVPIGLSLFLPYAGRGKSQPEGILVMPERNPGGIDDGMLKRSILTADGGRLVTNSKISKINRDAGRNWFEAFRVKPDKTFYSSEIQVSVIILDTGMVDKLIGEGAAGKGITRECPGVRIVTAEPVVG